MPIDRAITSNKNLNDNIKELLTALVKRQEKQDQVINQLIEASNKSVEFLKDLSLNTLGKNDDKVITMHEKMTGILSSMSELNQKMADTKIDLKPLVDVLEKNKITPEDIKEAMSGIDTQGLGDSIRAISDKITQSADKKWHFSIIRDQVGLIREINATQV